ncbi:Methyltransferase-Like Protein 27 [Manis pentadactyla]|nr:Methyltransferase-Like Protein 27 [Manis pentadactyla]
MLSTLQYRRSSCASGSSTTRFSSRAKGASGQAGGHQELTWPHCLATGPLTTEPELRPSPCHLPTLLGSQPKPQWWAFQHSLQIISSNGKTSSIRLCRHDRSRSVQVAGDRPRHSQAPSHCGAWYKAWAQPSVPAHSSLGTHSANPACSTRPRGQATSPGGGGGLLGQPRQPVVEEDDLEEQEIVECTKTRTLSSTSLPHLAETAPRDSNLADVQPAQHKLQSKCSGCWPWGQSGQGVGKLRLKRRANHRGRRGQTPACGTGPAPSSGSPPTPRSDPWRMAQEEGWSLRQVRARVGASHGITDLAHKLHFYDQWAPDYDQDVAALQYRAPRLAVDCLTQALPGLPLDALILDVACGTGLVAAELQARGFLQLHGVDGSPGMLEQARARGLYQCLSLCTLGQEPLPSSEGSFDAVLMVGALSDGQVPCSAIPELLRVTKPGGLVCLTTRTNASNLQYKEALEATLDTLEQAGAWERLVAWPVGCWELATSALEVVPGTSDSDSFISGIIYLYRKQEVAQVEGVGPSPQPLAGL